jgi:dipeptidyl aminopeptidase/acylaminoacyl peptidase
MGSTLQDSPEVWAEASPITYLEGSEPPFLLISSDMTKYIKTTQPENFVAELEALGVDVEVFILQNTVTHFLGLVASTYPVEDARAQAFEVMETFIADVLAD